MKNVGSNEIANVKVDKFEEIYGSLVKFELNGQPKVLQFFESAENLKFKFELKGNNIETLVYDTE